MWLDCVQCSKKQDKVSVSRGLVLKIVAYKYFQHWWHWFFIPKWFWKCLKVWACISGSGCAARSLPETRSMVLTLDHLHLSPKPLVLSSVTHTWYLLSGPSSPPPLFAPPRDGFAWSPFHEPMPWASFHGGFITKRTFPCSSQGWMDIETENVKESTFSSGLAFKSI